MSIKTIFKSLLALTTVFALASCAENDVFNPDKAQNTSSLKVPANFDWTTTRTITTGISSPVNTQVSIYSGKECKDNQLLAEVSVSKDKATEISLDLPTSCEAYYIQYPTADGTDVMEVKLTSTRAVDYTVVLPENAEIGKGDEDKNKDKTDLFFFPAKNTNGTIMFEDLFPEKGDYDFNDFVVGYNICTSLTRSDDNNDKISNDGITIKLQIRAIGGLKPYRFGFELSNLPTKYVRDNYNIKSDGSISFKLLEQEDDAPAIFVVTGANSLKDGSYYNTEKLSETSMPEITCEIVRNNFGDPTAYSHFQRQTDSYSFNFFIQNTQTNEEIHLKGYNVTALANNDNTNFSTSDNFVWGMKVPVLIPHAIEKVDFTEAYPKFASWVTSGGTNNADWYENYNPDKVINP